MRERESASQAPRGESHLKDHWQVNGQRNQGTRTQWDPVRP